MNRSDADFFVDDDGDTHEDRIDAITSTRITRDVETNAPGPRA